MAAISTPDVSSVKIHAEKKALNSKTLEMSIGSLAMVVNL
jgi:hypothetical protein